MPLAAWVVLAGTFVPGAVGAEKPGAVTLPPQVEKIDLAMQAGWADAGVKPSPVEDELKWCRRVYLDLIGRIPSFEELAEFAKDKAPSKKLNLVQKLLNDDRYTEEYANHWGTVWTNVLIGRNGGMEDRTLTDRSGMQKYLRDCFARNKPYNDMVYELVTATGSTKPGTEGFNGATNFLAMKVNEEDGTQATAAVSRIFLGLQVQCTQCHNHPFNQWKQQKFWEFNAFFRQTRALRKFVAGTRDVDHAELINQDFAGEGGRPDQAEIYFQLRNGLTKVAYPVFIDGTEIGKSGFVEQVNRREELGQLMMQSPFLDKAIVNRMWSHFLGYGFTKPIDDLGPHSPTSFPELFEELSSDFRNTSYDLKQLMVWITMSQPYQLSSRMTSNNETDDPSQGETPKFSHFYTRQMSAEQLFQSLAVATQANRKGSLEEQARRRDEWMKQFVVAFGTDEGDETTTFNGSIPQSLMMFNGELIREAISTDPGSWLGSIAQQKGSVAEKVQILFLTGLGRRPRSEELSIANQLLVARKNDMGGMLQDMWWAILNSNEFIFNH
ncbi:DUF1549 domain-containing protein [Pirellula sp. SH-Sr6A]|uniref:DUF1549 domain-containing protein n=1 Tax=Pirellula sp. SH-Sr6A TaxID=1632865 RepID=UPI0011BAC9DC|nr:DUF1549 domain-containing protein [Pirellula sp. SH-Sr6A]